MNLLAMLFSLQCGPTSGDPLVIYPRLFSPVELGQGALLLSAPGPDAYAASLRWHAVTLGIDRRARLRLGATVAAQYFSPDLDLLGGGRLSGQLLRFMETGGTSLNVALAAEGLAGTSDRRLAGGAVLFDVFGLVQGTARIGRELRDDLTFFELAVGTDLATWLRPPAKRPARRLPDPFPGLAGFLRVLAADVNVAVNELCQPEHASEARAASDGALLRDAAAAPNRGALDALLRARGVARLADLIQRGFRNAVADAASERVVVPDLNDAATARLIVEAIVAGWRKGLNLQ